MSDGEDSDTGVPSGVVSASSLIRDANSNADALSNGRVPMGWTYVNPAGVASNAIGFGLIGLPPRSCRHLQLIFQVARMTRKLVIALRQASRAPSLPKP